MTLPVPVPVEPVVPLEVIAATGDGHQSHCGGQNREDKHMFPRVFDGQVPKPFQGRLRAANYTPLQGCASLST